MNRSIRGSTGFVDINCNSFRRNILATLHRCVLFLIFRWARSSLLTSVCGSIERPGLNVNDTRYRSAILDRDLRVSLPTRLVSQRSIVSDVDCAPFPSVLRSRNIVSWDAKPNVHGELRHACTRAPVGRRRRLERDGGISATIGRVWGRRLILAAASIVNTWPGTRATSARSKNCL